MKNKIIMLISMMSIAAFIVSCSDDTDGGGTEPEDKEDVVYFDGNVETYMYNEYDLDSENNKVESSEHQDSLVYEQETQMDGRSASEYSVFTNAEGSYMADGSNYFSGETNKLYAHLSVFQSIFGNIEAEGFSLATFFDEIDQWFLIADNKAESWVLYDGELTFELPIAGPTTGDVKIDMSSAGEDAITIDGETMTAHKYNMLINIKATVTEPLVVTVDEDVTGEFWVVQNVGLVKSTVNSFAISNVNLNIDGYESVLVNYKTKTQVEN